MGDVPPREGRVSGPEAEAETSTKANQLGRPLLGRDREPPKTPKHAYTHSSQWLTTPLRLAKRLAAAIHTVATRISRLALAAWAHQPFFFFAGRLVWPLFAFLNCALFCAA